MDLQEKKRLRFDFLKLIYEATEGNQSYRVDGVVVGKELGIDRNTSSQIVQYLINEGLLSPMGAGLNVSITHAGVIEIETLLETPNEPTEHFPAINIVQIKNMNNSVIQQGNYKSNQNINFTNTNISEIKDFVEELRRKIEELNFSQEVKKEMSSELITIEAQVDSPKPKYLIINEALKTVRNLLEGVTGNAIAPMLIAKAQSLISMVSNFIG